MIPKIPIHLLPKRSTNRSARGQGIVVMMFFLAAFIVGPVCFFGYEVSLYNLAKLQLKAVLDAAALAAGTQQASDSSTNFSTVQSDAMATAYWMFSQNSILGDTLSTAVNEGTLSSPSTMTSVAGHKSEIGFQWVNPTTGGIVAQGDTTGKEIRVYGSYGFVPQFIGFAKLSGTFPVMDFSNGGLPELDFVLCFDLSSSMDDFTYVFLVHRFLNTGTGKADYGIVNAHSIGGNSNGLNPNGDGSQALYYALNSTNLTGSGTNCTWPTAIGTDGGPPNYYGGRGSANNNGSPPSGGNTSAGNTFTDIIVDVGYTQNAPMVGQKSYGDNYAWPTLNSANYVGMVVEASRGNLETAAIASTAGVNPTNYNTTWPAYFTTTGNLWSGAVNSWYNRYWSVANNWQYLNPIGAGALACETFFSTMNNDCDSHFGLVCYGSNEGSAPSTSGNGSYNNSGYGSNAYPWDNTGYTPIPYQSLDPNNTNFATVTGVFGTVGGIQHTYNGSGLVAPTSANQTSMINSQVKPNGSTDIAGSLHAALQELLTPTQGGNCTPIAVTGCRSNARTKATRAIVLFTDGLPTVSSLGGDSYNDAYDMAKDAGSQGIPVYCVGLCMTPALQTHQNDVLNDTTGISGLSAPSAQYFQATSSSGLEVAFEAVARSLVQLVRN